jgi:signal transduction histidine kinase
VTAVKPVKRGALKDATIMMVDDELTTIEITELFLQDAGFRKFVTTTDPREALDLLHQERPDVLLLDLVMPHVDGLDVLASVRANESLKHTPVIILTSSTEPDTKLRALELGVTDFLSKPVDPSELALRLQNTLAVRQHQQQLEKMVDERTAELNLMRIRAERASEAKSEFLANMSHELRTPLTAIAGYTDVLLEDDRVQADQRDSLQTIKRNGDRLLNMVNTLLDVCEMEAGHLQTDQAAVDLVQLVRRVGRELQPAAQERRLELALQFANQLPPQVVSDGPRIRRALGNLIENAIKFTEQGSVRVRVQYGAEASLACIDVIDTGIGIAPDAIPSLFLEFEQADGSTSKRYGGAGLGLAFTRRLARVLGGDCTLRSEVGAGTTATLTFRAPAASAAEPAAESGGETAAAGAATPAEPRAAATGGGGARPRILLVEDGVDNQRLIAMILRKAGADVEIAENGRIAVERLGAGESFDLLLMDMAMPEMDGYDATRTLRDMGCRMPIIALTAHGVQGEREKCLAAGCDDYATKPIDRNELIRIARAALAKRANRKPRTPA